MNKYEFERFVMELEGVAGELCMLGSSLIIDTEGCFADAATGSWRHLNRIIADMRGKLEEWNE